MPTSNLTSATLQNQQLRTSTPSQIYQKSKQVCHLKLKSQQSKAPAKKIIPIYFPIKTLAKTIRENNNIQRKETKDSNDTEKSTRNSLRRLLSRSRRWSMADNNGRAQRPVLLLLLFPSIKHGLRLHHNQPLHLKT